MEGKFSVNLQKLQDDFSKRLMEENRSKRQDEVRLKTIGDPNITYDQYR